MDILIYSENAAAAAAIIYTADNEQAVFRIKYARAAGFSLPGGTFLPELFKGALKQATREDLQSVAMQAGSAPLR